MNAIHLSSRTITSRLGLLEEKMLIKVKDSIGPRNQYKIKLTKLGILIAQKLKDIENLLRK